MDHNSSLPTVLVPRRILQETWSGLRDRSSGRRESACIWTGERSHALAQVTGVLFLEDFGPVDAGELHHIVSREALDALFSELRRTGKQIVVDVHTHPRGHTTLSPTDRAHPIEYRPGLIAAVIPDYACGPSLLSTVGAYTYLAGGGWRRLQHGEVLNTLVVRDL